MNYKVLFFTLVIAMTTVQALAMLVPIIYKELVDLIINPALDRDYVVWELYKIAGKYAMILWSMFVVWRLFDYAVINIEIKIMRNVWERCFAYLHRHSYKFFTDNFTGCLVKKVNRFVDANMRILDILSFNIIPMVVISTSILIVMFYYSLYLGFMFILWIIWFVFISVKLNKIRIPYQLEAVKKDTEMTGILSDTITNNLNISVFGAFKREFDYYKKNYKEWQVVTMKSWWKNALIYGALHFFTIIIEVLLILITIYLWSKGLITVGFFVLLLTYQTHLTGQLFQVAQLLRNLYYVLSDSAEMIEILDMPNDIKDIKGSKNLEVEKGSIEFQNISFAYNEWTNIFENLNLSIKAGEKVAFVWASGSGKSTLVKLLFRFFDLDDGSISIDGQDISTVKQDSLRSSISMVSQDPILFHRSLFENIEYGKSGATLEEVEQASKMANCHEFISWLKEGYKTLVWERWIKLSGWERQRVTIARALLANQKILVLDEATSSLDSESESLIQDAIYNVMENRTTIVIAHRLSTIMKMDRIVVLDHGKIVEQWTHKELTVKEGWVYKKLWDIQSGDFIE